MATTPHDRIDDAITALRLAETDGVPVLTATVDLGVGGDGRPVALRMLTQAVREAIGRYATDPGRAERASLEEDAEALGEAIEHAAGHGAAGLIFAGAAGAGLHTMLETTYPLRNAVDIGPRPALFELVRYRYLVGRAAVLAAPSLREVEITRVRYALVEDTEALTPSVRLEKHQQRTKREGHGAIDGAGGHAMNRVEQRVEAARAVFAHEAARELERFVQPGDLLIVAGVDEARSALIRRLPEPLRALVAEAPALDPTQDERSRAAWLTDFVISTQYAHGDIAARAWLSGAHSAYALGGLAATRVACEQGRLASLILHEDAVDHFGTAADARASTPAHDPAAVEALLHAALDQGAEILVTREPRVLAEQQGVLGVARY